MNKAIFLDRDGVINEVMSERVKFVNKKEDIYLLDGVADAIANFRQNGYKVFIVTNQGGVGLGFLKKHVLDEIHESMLSLLKEANAEAIIDEIAVCTHKPKAECTCRKPLPGMILTLATKHKIDLTESFMIGDMESDIECGLAAAVKTVLITKDGSTETKADYVRKNLNETLDIIK
jgi:D-glycero-D-manno-heptose 1,7-bisphosphate phosphatase